MSSDGIRLYLTAACGHTVEFVAAPGVNRDKKVRRVQGRRCKECRAAVVEQREAEEAHLRRLGTPASGPNGLPDGALLALRYSRGQWEGQLSAAGEVVQAEGRGVKVVVADLVAAWYRSQAGVNKGHAVTGPGEFPSAVVRRRARRF